MTTVSAATRAKVWRVIVIDDSPDDRADVRRLLLLGSERRYKLEDAETGAAGVRAILDAGDLPNCVILDYNLPDMEAVEVLAALAGPDGLTVCPVVVLTGAVDQEQTRALLRAGAQDYLGKSWTTAESLTRAVENAAERWAMSRELLDRDASLREANQQLNKSLHVGRAVAFTWDIPLDEIRRLDGVTSHPGTSTDRPRTFEETSAKIHPDDRAAFERRVRHAIERPGREYTNDYRVVGPDGSVRWISDSGRVEFSADLKPSRLIWLATDVTDRKRLEEEKAEALQLLETLLAHAPVGFAFFDCELRFVRINERLAEINGYSVEAHLGRPVAEILPTLATSLREVAASILATGQPVLDHEFTGETARAPGVIRTWNGSWYPVHDQGGKIIGFGSVVEEITHRKHSEAALRLSTDRINLAVKCSRAVLWQQDLDLRFTWLHNPAPGIDGSEAVGKRDEDLLERPEDAAVIVALKREVIRSGVGVRQEFYAHIRGVRHCFELLIEPLRSASGLIAGLTGAASDITERKQAQQALADRTELLNGVLEGTTDVIFVKDLSGRVLLANAACAAVFSSTSEQVVGRTNEELMPPDLANAVRQHDEAVVASGSQIQREETFLVAGEPRDFLTLKAPLRDGGGRIVGVLGISRDITERRRNEEQLRRLATELSEADRRKDEFLATLAHELRNPLAPIRAGLHIMKLAGNDPTLVKESIGMMERQVSQMTHLIGDLMDLSRISRGKIVLKKARLSLTDVVHDAVDISRPLIEERGHNLVVEMPSEPIFVDADRTRLAQVFGNLLNNAAQYTDNGGRIRLAVEPHCGEVVVSVEDNGVGISAPMLTRVFDMFAQVDRSLEKSHGGLGIGLNIVKRLVEMHDGSVVAESGGQGAGSRFVVRLPIALSLNAEQCDEEAKGVTAAARRRILVVDDNQDAANSLAAVLKLMGHELQTAYDGLEALHVAAAFRPDLMLLDIGMPKLNGYDTARRIREQPWGKGIVLVALTGWGQDEDKRKSEQAGFNAHLVKPVDPAALDTLLGGLKPSATSP